MNVSAMKIDRIEARRRSWFDNNSDRDNFDDRDYDSNNQSDDNFVNRRCYLCDAEHIVANYLVVRYLQHRSDLVQKYMKSKKVAITRRNINATEVKEGEGSAETENAAVNLMKEVDAALTAESGKGKGK
jgi:hypothetical protein